jgi:hypothetical protein
MIKVLSMVFLLILTYLFIFNGEKTVMVINSFAQGSKDLIVSLQGR